MRMSSATIPRYSSSSSISSSATRKRHQSRHTPTVVDDYALLELPLRWRDPPPEYPQLELPLRWRDPPPIQCQIRGPPQFQHPPSPNSSRSHSADSPPRPSHSVSHDSASAFPCDPTPLPDLELMQDCLCSQILHLTLPPVGLASVSSHGHTQNLSSSHNKNGDSDSLQRDYDPNTSPLPLMLPVRSGDPKSTPASIMTTLPFRFPFVLPRAPLKPTSPLPACDQDPSRMVKKPMTICELMSVQMKVFEPTNSRILHGLLRISTSELGRRTKSIILPLKLLQQFITSDFPNQQKYEAWRRRNLKLLEFVARLAYKMFEDLPKRNVDIEKCKPTISPAIAFEVEHAEKVHEFAIIDMVEPVPLSCKENLIAIQSLPNSSSSTLPPTLPALLQSIKRITLVTISSSQLSYSIPREMATLKSRIEDADMVANDFIGRIPNSGQCVVADLLGDCCITTYDCPIMLKSLMKVVDENIVLALEGASLEAEWNAKFVEYEKKFAAELKTIISGELLVGWEKVLPTYTSESNSDVTRNIFQQYLNALASALPDFLGGSADHASSKERNDENKIFDPGICRLQQPLFFNNASRRSRAFFTQGENDAEHF